MFCLWLPPNLDGLLAAPREAAAFLQAWEILAGRERGVLARWAAAPGHIAYRSRAPAALCCDRPHLIRFISQTKSRGVKFELAGKRYPSKEIIIFCAVKCIIGIFRRFIKTVKKKKRRKKRDTGASFTCWVYWSLFPSARIWTQMQTVSHSGAHTLQSKKVWLPIGVSHY